MLIGCQAVLLFFCAIHEISGQEINGEKGLLGTNFIFAFPLNSNGLGAVPYVTITNPSKLPASVNIEADCLDNGFLFNITVEGNRCYTKKFPEKCQVTYRALGTGIQKNQRKGIHITSGASVTVVASVEHTDRYSVDSFAVLPTNQLSLEYYSVTTRNMHHTELHKMNTFSVIAAHDDTNVKIFNGTTLVDSHKFARDLGTWTYSDYEDLTGWHIMADKPVSVISGCRCAENILVSGACDMVVAMLPPISAWGKRFPIVSLTPNPHGNFLRVVVSRNQTQVTYKGTTKPSQRFCREFPEWCETLGDKRLDAGAFTRIYIPPDDIGILSTSEPALVIQQPQNGREEIKFYGGPSFVIVPSLRNQATYAVFSTSGLEVLNHKSRTQHSADHISQVHPIQLGSGITHIASNGLVQSNNGEVSQQTHDGWQHYVAIVSDAKNVDQIWLDEAPINSTWDRIPTSTQLATRLNISSGRHVISSTDENITFSAIVYGFSYDRSYAFVAAMTLAAEGAVEKEAVGRSLNIPVNFCLEFVDYCGAHGRCQNRASSADTGSPVVSCICDDRYYGQRCQYEDTQNVHQSKRCKFTSVHLSQENTNNTLMACPAEEQCIPEDFSCFRSTCAHQLGWCIPVIKNSYFNWSRNE